jgi:hypothetical protein
LPFARFSTSDSICHVDAMCRFWSTCCRTNDPIAKDRPLLPAGSLPPSTSAPVLPVVAADADLLPRRQHLARRAVDGNRTCRERPQRRGEEGGIAGGASSRKTASTQRGACTHGRAHVRRTDFGRRERDAGPLPYAAACARSTSLEERRGYVNRPAAAPSKWHPHSGCVVETLIDVSLRKRRVRRAPRNRRRFAPEYFGGLRPLAAVIALRARFRVFDPLRQSEPARHET